MPVLDITKNLTSLFLKQAKATPDAVALEDEKRTLTYAELDQETDILANRLQSHGIKRDDKVGVLLGRSANYVIACLAALRAGGAFLVLEVAYPPGLLADVIADAKPTVVVTETTYASMIKNEIPLIVVDGPEKDINGETAANGIAKGSSTESAKDDLESLAFVSYTSGTTGRPKGIANPHRAAVRSYDLRFGLSDLKAGDRVACNVFFVWEILRPLLRGATVIAVPDDASYDPIALVNLLSSRKVTETLMTPTLLATILSRHTGLGQRLPDLRTLWLNGEVVTTDLVRRAIRVLPNVRLLNCYSASETHEIACGDIKEIFNPDASVCPVGPPLDPEHTYILDESGNQVEAGTSGELFVGGHLLAHGYLNRPETTAQAFVPDPFDGAPGARMYRTGDLARILPSGLLEITGRVGAMIKVRGYSVQPGAIEASIMRHLAVRHCAVISHGEGLERQLVAYIVRDREPGDRAELALNEGGYSPTARRTLSAHLAHYMIPALWVELDELPTHDVSGKADLKRLPPPSGTRTRGTTTPTGFERDTKVKIETIADLWATSLNVPVSIINREHDEHDFFDLGGHSLALSDLAGRLTKTFGFTIPVGRLVENPTLQGHLDAVIAARDGYTTSVQADLPKVLKEDATLEEKIQPKGTTMCPISEAQTVLLTGATGFLGAFLLRSILERTSANVICVVRFPDPTEVEKSAGMARLRKNLLDLGLWNDAYLDRIEVLPANLARNRIGLSPDAFESLASRIQVIIHAGATVNLVYPYAALRKANVGGTREILRLACRAGATLHHVSTNGVLPPSVKGWDEDAMIDIDDVPTQLLDGYSQTKWVAEQLIMEAGRRGLPARIYRPGTISGHSVSGATNAWDLLTAIIVESLQLGRSPEVSEWYAEMTPVDSVSDAIVTLANHADTKQKLFHIGDANPVTARSVFENLAELGYKTEPLGWDDWVALWAEKRGSGKKIDSSTTDILRSGMPTADFLQSVTVLKDGMTKPILESYGLQRSKIDTTLLATYARHFYTRGWLPNSPKQPSVPSTAVSNTAQRGPLAGKVAIITGASSGIGAAIATALSFAGAHVTLAARRADALSALKNKLKTHHQSGKVLAHPTDVTSSSSVNALVETTTKELGEPDILICAAGVMYFTLMTNAHIADWERTVDVNCKGLLYPLGAVVPGMVTRGRGHVLAISSDAGRKVFPGLGVYSGSKFFVEAVLQSLRLETAGTGLRVTSVQPGNVDTGLLGMSTDEQALKKYGSPSGAKVLDAEDVARAVVFALSQPEHVAVNEVLVEPRDEPI